jgi:CheY-like chemotaxis protein
VIVAFSARTLNNELQKCIEEGFDEFLRKPVQMDVVYRMLTDLVGAQFEYSTERIAVQTDVIEAEPGYRPCESQLKPLRKALKKGDVDMWLKALKKIAAGSSSDESWAIPVRSLLESYDIVGVLKMLE